MIGPLTTRNETDFLKIVLNLRASGSRYQYDGGGMLVAVGLGSVALPLQERGDLLRGLSTVTPL